MLAELARAYSTMDNDQVRVYWPTFTGFDARTKQLARSLELSFRGVLVSLADDGQTAAVSGTRIYTYDWKRSELPKTQEMPFAWKLRKRGNTWIVEQP